MRKYIIVCDVCERADRATTNVSIKVGDERAKPVALCDEHLDPISKILGGEAPQTRGTGRGRRTSRTRVTTPDAIDAAKETVNA